MFFRLLVVALLTRGTLQTRARSWVVSAAGLVVVVAVGVSRVYLGYHWMTDVLGGWAVGSALVAAQGEGDSEPGSAKAGAVDGDRPLVRGDDASGDREPET